MQGKLKRYWPEFLISIFALLCLSLIIAYWWLTRPHAKAHVPADKLLYAEYENYRFSVENDEGAYRFITGWIDLFTARQEPVADLFVRILKRPPVRLPELTPRMAATLLEDGVWEARQRSEDNATVLKDYTSMLIFREDRLSYANLRDTQSVFELGPTADGPFVSLPMSRARMLEVFGKPKRWRWERRPPRP